MLCSFSPRPKNLCAIMTRNADISDSPDALIANDSQPTHPDLVLTSAPPTIRDTADDYDEADTLGPFVDSTSSHVRDTDHLQLPNRGRPAISRSTSVLSFQALNQSVGRFVKDIRVKFHHYRHGDSDHPQPHQNQIYYSVFKAPPDLKEQFHAPVHGCSTTGPVSQSQFDSIVDSVVDAMESGILPKLISQGSSGSYFMYDTSGKVMGVFKPKDEEPYGPLSPKWTKWLHRNLFPCFFGRPCLVPNNGYICEAGASLLDRQLQTHIVPFTDIVYLSSRAFYYRFFDRRRHYVKGKPLPNKVGSFQLFLHGYQQADVFLRKHPLPDSSHHGSWTPPHPLRPASSFELDEPHFEWTPEILRQFREELEKLVILDYIMRNTDRGLDNWMIKVEWETVLDEDLIEVDETQDSTIRVPKLKTVPRIRIGAIDSGLAFPWKHPDKWRSYPFGWLFLPLSIIGQPFSQKTRDHFLPMLCSSEWWEETGMVMKQLFSQDAEFKERLWKKQWAVLKGQAFNVVETLKCREQGPLELVRRTRVLVLDDGMDVPVHIPYPSSSMEYPPSSGAASMVSDEDEVRPLRHYSEGSMNPPSRNKSADARLQVPKKKKHPHDSSMSLEARYRALESNENLRGRRSGGTTNLFDELISYADQGNEDESDRHTISCSDDVPESYKPVNNVGFSVVEGQHATRRVIVERLKPVTSKPPVFTWC